MILQALKQYYDRLAADPESGIPKFGYSREKISWAIVVDREGNMVPPLLDLRDCSGRKPVPRDIVVPQRVKKSVNIAPNFLWGDSGYVLGVDGKGNPIRSQQTFEAFRNRVHEVGDSLDDEGMMAVLKFLDCWNPADAVSLDNWDDISGTNIVFRLDGVREYVHDRSPIGEVYLRSIRDDRCEDDGWCLVTGEESRTVVLHPAIHGVRGAQSSGANIVSFNKDAFCSYGKEQGDNAPVGEAAAFAYTTALNWLLRSGSGQKIQIADTTTVFWAERPSIMERSLFHLFNPPKEASAAESVDDTSGAKDIWAFLDAVRRGRYHDLDPDNGVRFYILGLAPNAARISVRFWQADTVGVFADRLGKHLRDIHIQKQYTTEPDVPGIWQLLAQTSPQNKLDNVSPLLGGALMRAILTGGAYPESLLIALVGRIRAEQDEKNRNTSKINYYRMSLLKGCLVRNHQKEVPVSLNKEKTDPAYLLGRLFSVLERAQEDASGGQLNSTIKDRYFGAASATPGAVFPLLLRLNQHHVAKGNRGGYFTRLIGEILERMPAAKLPAHLPLEDQGLFAIGYYHQRNDFFRKQEKTGQEIAD